MFGIVTADPRGLTREQQLRYRSVYCGICRQIRLRASSASRLALQYDMAFLALLLMSLYEPQEQVGKPACGLHPLRPRQWVDNPYIAYAADMNVALAYYKALDDETDEGKWTAAQLKKLLGKNMDAIRQRWSRQCRVIEEQLAQLNRLEQENCANPDLPAEAFGLLMAELFVPEEDHWSQTLRQTGMALGRFIYLADSAMDYRRDIKKHQYNPFLAMGQEESREQWEQYLTLIMARCTDYYERLPLVQDKAILDNILYSGIWIAWRGQKKERERKA